MSVAAESLGAAALARHVRRDGALAALTLSVDGVHCGACVQRIERGLARLPGVVSARLNLTTRRLAVTWRADALEADDIVAALERMGYRAAPALDEAAADRARERALLRALAVAGFAAGNVMLLSIAVWAGADGEMGPATRGLMHWLQALVALPAIVYAGRPFFHSAFAALARRSANMDVPISLAVVLAAAMSLYETIVGGAHAYFDSAVTLLFFLLIGRYLDHRARGRARSAAAHLLALKAGRVVTLAADGSVRVLAPEAVAPGMTATVAAGERIAVDGRVASGRSDVDTSLITGESAPRPVGPGDVVHAGTLNLTAPLAITVTAAGEATVLADIVRLMEAAEQGRARFVERARRIAQAYVPAVHGLAAATFAGWLLLVGAPWQQALMNAVAVLIVTCPCALALAVPVVQVVAAGRLFRQGVPIKSATALERLAAVDTVVFDKTGTLTLGRPELVRDGGVAEDDLALAAALAAASRHPLARALVAAAGPVRPLAGVVEHPGLGLAWDGPEGQVRLGSRRFCGVAEDDRASLAELWLARPGRPPLRFAFRDAPRADARATIAALRRAGYRVALLSGDRPPAVAEAAAAVGIEAWKAALAPGEKCAELAALAAAGRRVAMVGDGLNDAPALAAAHASLSPAEASDIAQTAADVVFQGERLAPLAETLAVARDADRLVKQNFGLAFVYNALTVPLAVAGLVTPLLAAVAMSASSLAVTANALRLGRGARRWT